MKKKFNILFLFIFAYCFAIYAKSFETIIENEFYQVIGDNLRIRSKPDLKGKITGFYRIGDVVFSKNRTVSKVRLFKKSYYWHQTEKGWVYGKYLIKDCDNPEIFINRLSKIEIKNKLYQKLHGCRWLDSENDADVVVTPEGEGITPVCTELYFKNSVIYNSVNTGDYLLVYRVLKAQQLKDDLKIFVKKIFDHSREISRLKNDNKNFIIISIINNKKIRFDDTIYYRQRN